MWAQEIVYTRFNNAIYGLLREKAEVAETDAGLLLLVNIQNAQPYFLLKASKQEEAICIPNKQNFPEAAEKKAAN